MNTHEPPGRCPVRLPALSLGAKLTLTLFLLLVGGGYLVAVAKIYVWHNAADGVPGMSPDDLRAVFHGLEREVTEEVRNTLASEMLREVRPGGGMRRYLMRGGESAERALIGWLESGASEADFSVVGRFQAGDPSAKQVIAAQCIECHNAAGGDAHDLPYADARDAEPRYELVARVATPVVGEATEETRVIRLEPISSRELLHSTHAHILSIPVFTLIVAGLFLLTDVGPRFKAVLAPLPMLAVLLDIGSWWLARPFEPFAYVIAAAGALFGVTYGLQILCILACMWVGKRPAPEPGT